MNLLIAAKIYRDKYKFSVFPVTLSYKLDSKGCYETKMVGGKEVRKIDKKPAIPSWKEYQNRFATDEELEQGFSNPKVNGIGLVTGDISQITVLDWDEIDSPYESPIMVKTITGGFHSYYRYAPGVRNTVKVGGKTLDVRGDGGFVVIPPSSFGDHKYEWIVNGNPEELLKQLPEFPLNVEEEVIVNEYENYKKPFDLQDAIGATSGARNTQLHKLACSALSRNYDIESVKILVDSVNKTFLPPLDQKEIDSLFNSACDFVSKEKTKNNEPALPIAWPAPLANEAFYGLAGDFVKTVAPHTEADEAALMFNFLCTLGSVIGSGPHIEISAISHPLRLFCVLVGKTSKGRKGDSWGYPRRIFESVDPTFLNRISSGMVSGEGLIWNVRDEIRKMQPIKKQKSKEIEGYQEVITDEGVADKRLLVVESEFASVLKALTRKENTLSAIIRDAWDTGNLRTLAKNCPAKSTGAHISIMGHITNEELIKLLSDIETSNGFGNRFLWICVSRSKSLPFGGELPDIELQRLKCKIQDVVNFAKNVNTITWDEETKPLWKETYPELSAGLPGLVGAMTSRSESYVTRIAGIYALLDKSILIKPQHLLAALAIWDYAENSARYIFQTKSFTPIMKRILEALTDNKQGMTRTAINNALSRNYSSEDIKQALVTLLSLGLLRKTESSSGIELWFSVERQRNS